MTGARSVEEVVQWFHTVQAHLGSNTKFTHWFTGFIGTDDHDTGAAVSYAHSVSTLFYGAPSAQNWAGTTLYGSGRVYISVFCQENHEIYNIHGKLIKHLKACRRVQQAHSVMGQGSL